MRPSASKLIVTVVLALSSSLLVSASAAYGQVGSHDKRLPYDSSADAVDGVRQIETAVALDAERQILLNPYDENAIDVLVDALRSPFEEVRSSALGLLALAVKQLDIPRAVLHQTIVPAVSGVEERYRAASSPEEARLAELARRVLWHVRVKEMTSGREQLQFLLNQLDNREDGFYYPFEALEYIVATGSPDGREILESKLAESQRRSMSGKLLQQVRTAKQELEIQIRLGGSDAANQAAELREAFQASRGDRSFAGQGFRVWLIRQAVDRRLEGLAGFLGQVSSDETLEPRVRYEAEQTVRQLKGLPPRSRSQAPLID